MDRPVWQMGRAATASGLTSNETERGASMPNQYDVIVIGGGHNGLIAAAYLARAGRRVCVLERRHVLGGCAVTEELWPGYHVSTAAYVISLLLPEIIEDLRLKDYGLRILPRSPSSFTPTPDGQSLTLGPGPGHVPARDRQIQLPMPRPIRATMRCWNESPSCWNRFCRRWPRTRSPCPAVGGGLESSRNCRISVDSGNCTGCSRRWGAIFPRPSKS